ncbi:MAG TPA: hypothetical protein VF405_12210 [Gammaproteobacteria bacterium]
MTGGSKRARLPRAAAAAWLVALLGVAPLGALAQEIEFASIEKARAVLGVRDDFVARLSPFDRAARLKSADDVSESEYLAFTMASAREWSNDERARLTSAFAAVKPKLTELLPELDAPILLIRTSGEEEGGADYTRGNAVMLPRPSNDERQLQRTLAHEVFHIVSRNNPQLKQALYRAIGFEQCGEVALPEALAARKITNPDAPVNEHCIEITVDGATAWGMPVLLSRQERYDPAAGIEFFGYLTLSMLLVDRTATPARPLLRDGAPVLVPINRVAGFLEQVGSNTSYILHAEEILASNFERLVLGEQGAPSPEVLERIRAELTRAAAR